MEILELCHIDGIEAFVMRSQLYMLLIFTIIDFLKLYSMVN